METAWEKEHMFQERTKKIAVGVRMPRSLSITHGHHRSDPSLGTHPGDVEAHKRRTSAA